MKIVHLILVASLLVAGIGNLNAQVTDFKLSDYKYRTPLYQSLQLDLDLEQSSSSRKNEGGGINASLNAFVSNLRVFATDTRQHISIRSAFLQPRFANNKQGDIKNIDNGLSGGVRYSSMDRLYRKEHFIELGGAAGAQSFNRKSGVKDQAVGQGERHANLELAAGIGKGRLEYVHDAQAALLLLEELYAYGIIKSRVNAETANQLAQLITNIKKQRILDSRRRNIYKLNQVDSFLRVNKLVTQCDAKSVTIINDILFFSFQNDLSGNNNTFENPLVFSWNRGNYDEGFERTDFGLIPQIEPLSDQAFRQHGTIMYARLVPELRYNAFNTTIEKPASDDSTTKSSYLYVIPGIQVGYENHRAINLKWQKNYAATFGFAHTSYLESKPNQNSDYSMARLNLNYEIGYYPNSRTVVEANANLGISLYTGGMKATFITPGIALNTGYFISYNTVLRASFHVNYSKQTGAAGESTLAQSLRLYLRHYFF